MLPTYSAECKYCGCILKVQLHVAYHMEALLAEVDAAALNADSYILITSVLVRYSAPYASIIR